MFGGNFAPVGWAFCQGQTLPISENETLFQLIGTTYGGDGEETFNLPNLQGRIPLHMGTGPSGTTYQIGEQAGVESVTLTTTQIPNHTHVLTAATGPGTTNTPGGNLLAQTSGVKPYFNDVATTNMASTSITGAGGSQPHDNLQPYLVVNFIISLFGVFPSPT